MTHQRRLVLIVFHCGSKELVPKLLHILAELFNMCLKVSCFQDCLRVSLVVPMIKNVGDRSTAKNYCPVSLLSVLNKVFGKLVNNRVVDQKQKCGLFSDFQYGFRSSWSTADQHPEKRAEILKGFEKYYKMEHHKISKALNDSTVSKFVKRK